MPEKPDYDGALQWGRYQLIAEIDRGLTRRSPRPRFNGAAIS